MDCSRYEFFGIQHQTMQYRALLDFWRHCMRKQNHNFNIRFNNEKHNIHMELENTHTLTISTVRHNNNKMQFQLELRVWLSLSSIDYWQTATNNVQSVHIVIRKYEHTQIYMTRTELFSAQTHRQTSHTKYPILRWA